MSRLPVGSSANNNGRLPAIARAIATHVAVHPTIGREYGAFYHLGRPALTPLEALDSACFESTPDNSKAIATLSNADKLLSELEILEYPAD